MLTVTDAKSEFKLGRGHESEVRINDISVSRCHAIIKCKKDGFYIEDNLSKFGTIVLLKNTLRLAEDHTMAVQVGRSVVSFTIKNIDVDRKMREKLKREIAPLLSKNRGLNLNGAANQNKVENQPVKIPAVESTTNNNGTQPQVVQGAAASGGSVPIDTAYNNNGQADGQSMGLSSAERPALRDRAEVIGAYSASREGKRLNMLGFNAPSATHAQHPSSNNDRDRDLSGLMGAYSSSNRQAAAAQQ